MKITRVSALALSLAAAPVLASDLDLSLTNDSVKGQVNFFGSQEELQMGAGYTYHEGSRHIINFHSRLNPNTTISLRHSCGHPVSHRSSGVPNINLSAGNVEGTAIQGK